MLANSVTVIFFRVINCAALIGLSYYLFRRYIKNKVDEKITQKEMLLKGLEEQGYFLEGKINSLDAKLEKQETRIDLLKQKIDDWAMQVAGEKVGRMQEYKRNAAQSAQRIAIKNEQITQQIVRTQTVPQALNRAEQTLAKKFDEHARMQYVNTLIHRLEGK
jgi:F0F1-type ATP synthase membrane subunit b/b'